MRANSVVSPTAPPAVVHTFLQCDVPALRTVSVSVEEDIVVLRGRLPSYYLKQLAQERILPHLNGRGLENRIIVVQH
jgi:hypothetical protein